ncbi:DUF3313 family protein [Chromobacterium sp. IIBBL 290-4]|uniref:DUF3313 family protein n=1 Tax=Chromobacterium sp. IIBBL 290-4 TaxID=2953890 RepID=UPI0020B6FFF4|nr:DUF3313 family protein [Chromobacterium sp. IIBBL 290-4]UTH72374.1 DUF3313 domain-containing protein [Chromobacterium sp. IIBBL 290-4]
MVAWSELCRVARAHEPAGAPPPQAFSQAGRSHQFIYAGSAQSLAPYRAVLLEPVWLLDQQQDGRWQLAATAPGSPLSLRLQTLLRAWLPDLPLADEAGPGVASMRLALRSRQGRITRQASYLPPQRPAQSLSPLVRGIAPYLDHVASILQLEDSVSGRLLGGGVTLRAAEALQTDGAPSGWADLLSCDWLRLLQFEQAAMAG